ncbi:hypothetical protein AB3Y40_03995 [Yoonia sp. R2331]|uniref:hypothetical protein n=1 Tax=Yoonia sp. R2331 TaxID=3237238 RepID=UPI0034E54073
MSHLTRKQAVRDWARSFATPDTAAQQLATRNIFAKDAIFHVVHPWNDITGVNAYLDQFIAPLARAFRGFHRRDDILIGGAFEGGDWVATHGNYVGHFGAPLIGLTPSDRLEYLRFGEFHRFEGDHIVETYLYLDLPQLMIATDQWPDSHPSPATQKGYTGFIPGPATQDGLQLVENDAAHSTSTYQLVTDMLSGLATKNEAWRPYWHNNMMWYGPAAFGSFVGVEDFAAFQVPFEGAFSFWGGGSSNNGVTKHFTRFGDGDYAALGGWPSLMTVRKDAFLGQPSDGATLLMRVCDWYRRSGDLLIENWVMVDIPDVLLQMGVDLFPQHHAVPPGPRNF